MITFENLRPRTARAVRRSRKLEELLVALWRFGPLTEVEAAQELRVTLARLQAIVDGDGRSHRLSIAAVELGLVIRERSRRGTELHLTTLGADETTMILDARARGRRV